MANTAHKPGCEALGGYGVGACSCGAYTQDMRYAHGEVAERCEDVKRAMDVVVELERRGMLEAQPVAREPLTVPLHTERIER